MPEFAAALGMSTEAGKHYLGQGLELCYRLPRLWARVHAGDLPAWKARLVARDSIRLTAEAAEFVDRHVAPVAHRVKPAQLDRLVNEAIGRYMPEEVARLAEASWDERHVTICEQLVSFTGTMTVAAELDIADALDLEAAVAAGAAHRPPAAPDVERSRVQRCGRPSTVRFMSSDEFVPVGFDAPTSLATDRFRLEPLGPEHNERDHAAWMSSIDYIRSLPGYPDGKWPPPDGMTLEDNLRDLRRHAEDFTRGAGFTFTVLDPDDDVIGCVYLYPSPSEEWDVTVQSWVRADSSDLDEPLADAVARWLATAWPWERLDRCGR